MVNPVIDLAELLTISVGRSRKETDWKQTHVTWDQLVERMREPVVTDETVAAFRDMSKDQQAGIKDVGGFVGGELEGARSLDNVKSRCIVAFDADYASPDLWDNWQLFVGCAALVHSTHKHTPEHPRLRILAPLKRPVTPAEYEPMARRVAEWIGIENFDDTTYEINRLMFWPSRPSDGEYVFDVVDGDWLDPDAVLATYHDWHDMREWPRSSRQDKILRKMGEKQGDPLTKPGVIGAFNRAYTITEALVKFLPDRYTPCGENRWTFTGGTTSGGAIVYDDDTFFYSHHDHDPIHNRLCNAFDLVRLHLFGDQDAGVDGDLSDMPSMKAMRKLCADDEKVRAQLAEAIRQDPSEVFGEPTDRLERFVEDLTEQGTALGFVDRFGAKLRFSNATGWMLWDDEKWELNTEAEAYMLAMSYADELYGQARVLLQAAEDKGAKKMAEGQMRRAEKLRSARGMKAMLNIAGNILTDPKPEEYDADGWILNTPEGVVDLKTGELREHNPEYKCTKITSCGLTTTPKGVKMWDDFIRHITAGDVSFADYLQTLAGMAAVGEIYEEGLVISYGPGGNGKSTFFGALSTVLGDYARTVNADLLVPSYGHPDLSYVAALRGVRLSVMGETEENARMSVAMMKRITSRDKITGRALYKDPIEFTPTHTTIMHTNHLPRLGSLDGGTQRRIAVAPFLSTLPPEEVITNYERVLIDAAGGAILQWIVDGAVMFYNSGCKLRQPEVVRKATEGYLSEEDTVQQFIEEYCETSPEWQEPANDLYMCYKAWAERSGLYVRSLKNFGKALSEKGYDKKRTNTGIVRIGLRLRTQ